MFILSSALQPPPYFHSVPKMQQLQQHHCGATVGATIMSRHHQGELSFTAIQDPSESPAKYKHQIVLSKS